MNSSMVVFLALAFARLGHGRNSSTTTEKISEKREISSDDIGSGYNGDHNGFGNKINSKTFTGGLENVLGDTASTLTQAAGVPVSQYIPYTINSHVNIPVPQPYEVSIPRPVPYKINLPQPFTAVKPVPALIKRPVAVPAPQSKHVPVVQRVSEPYPVTVPQLDRVKVAEPVFVNEPQPMYFGDGSGGIEEGNDGKIESVFGYGNGLGLGGLVDGLELIYGGFGGNIGNGHGNIGGEYGGSYYGGDVSGISLDNIKS